MQANANLENALQSINRTCISLSESEIKRNNAILDQLVTLFVAEMKKDTLFNELFERVFYGGSFYDGLRVAEPNEFDLDLLLRIPKRLSPTIDITNVPGFVTCKINRTPDINNTLSKMIDKNGFLETALVRRWMEGITVKALSQLCPTGELKINSYTFKVTTSKSGPAMTIYLQGSGVTMDIDFIPCFVFGQDKWPKGGYRSNPRPGKPEFFIVPKTPKRDNLPCKIDILWRLSFQEQERLLIDGKQFLKPALKLLKKLRDHQKHKAIASYYIKTLFLWEVEQNGDVFNKSLAYAFLAVLGKYTDWLKKGEIPYFWNKKNNLLVGVNRDTLENYANRLERMRLNLNSDTVYTYLGAS